MSYADNYPEVRTKSFLQFATSGTYTPDINDPVVDDAVDCYMRIKKNSVIVPTGYDSGTIEVGIRIKSLVSEVATPQRGAKFSYSGTSYTVHSIADDDTDDVFVTCVVSEDN